MKRPNRSLCSWPHCAVLLSKRFSETLLHTVQCTVCTPLHCSKERESQFLNSVRTSNKCCKVFYHFQFSKFRKLECKTRRKLHETLRRDSLRKEIQKKFLNKNEFAFKNALSGAYRTLSSGQQDSPKAN